jgi:hypothetical protein
VAIEIIRQAPVDTPRPIVSAKMTCSWNSDDVLTVHSGSAQSGAELSIIAVHWNNGDSSGRSSAISVHVSFRDAEAFANAILEIVKQNRKG